MISRFIEYLSIERNYSLHTCKSYERHLVAFQDYCHHILEIDEISKVDYIQIRSWIILMVEQGLTNRTVNNKIASLRAFYKYLIKIKVLEDSPLSFHKPLKIKKHLPIPFSKDEMFSLLDFSGKDFNRVRDLSIIWLFYATGIRRGELINLQEKDVDFNMGQLKVLGKRNKERYIPLLPEVISHLERYLLLKRKQGFAQKCLFVTDKGEKIYETFVYRLIRYYLGEVSSKEKKSPHVIRHTFATHLISKGADLNAVKELLGHTSLAATQVYVQTDLARLKKSYNQAHPRGRKN